MEDIIVEKKEVEISNYEPSRKEMDSKFSSVLSQIHIPWELYSLR